MPWPHMSDNDTSLALSALVQVTICSPRNSGGFRIFMPANWPSFKSCASPVTINSDPPASAHSRIRLSDGSSFTTSTAHNIDRSPRMDFFREIGDSCPSRLDRFISPSEFVASDMGHFLHNRVGIARTMSPLRAISSNLSGTPPKFMAEM